MKPPRGRRPLGCVWNNKLGKWEKIDGSIRKEIVRQSTPRPEFVIQCAPPPVKHVPPDTAPSPQCVQPQNKDTESRRINEQSKAEPYRNDPARSHALWCASSLPPHVLVYYMNTEGMLVLLGKEPVRKQPREVPVHPKRLRRVDVKVWGPDDARKLEAGEWELEEQLVWV
jgi:hypothetical protein